VGVLEFLTINRFSGRTPIANIKKNQKKDGHCVHNNFDLTQFVQASPDELPSKPSCFVAILQECCDNRANAIDASKKN
jgi:hypothetical protein